MTTLATTAANIAALAGDASTDNAVDAFLSSTGWALFLLDAEAAGYVYNELVLPLDGCSVRNAADQAFQFACSVEQNESAPDTVAHREAEALTARIAAAGVAEPLTGTRYLEEAELDHLVLEAKLLRKGRKLAAFTKAPYLVIVDGEYLWLRDVRALRRTLSSCYLNWTGVVPFRNYDNGVTFNLDQPREAAREAVRAAVPVWVEQEEQEQQQADGAGALGTLDFIIAAEDGSLTQEQFEASAQAFVDSGVWRSLQGSWGRAVASWAEEGLVTL
jgi:hypothetical protein